MRMGTPRWWYVRHNQPMRITRALAWPLSMIWAAATAYRIARAAPVDPGVPVICVGNLTLGGSGKTPIVGEVVRRLRAAGREAHVLSRGHGGRLSGPILVDPGRHTAIDVGDEPLMLAAEGPVWVARDRVKGALAAAAAGAQVIVMDDGHQNPSVSKALSLMVVDGETRDGEWPFGDGSIFPRGPLREPLAAGLARADAVVVLLPSDIVSVDPDLATLFSEKTVLIAHLEPVTPPPAEPQVGFAGIAKPWRVERALKAAGCRLADFAPLADHQRMSESTLKFLARRAADLGAGLITTEKDWIRLSPRWRERVTSWPVRARFDDDQALDRLLATIYREPPPS